MVIGHTPAQLGDDPIVRLRFAPLAPSAPKAVLKNPARDTEAKGEVQGPAKDQCILSIEISKNFLIESQLEERGLSTADLRARVALKERESVRPPDPGTVDVHDFSPHEDSCLTTNQHREARREIRK
eukprot:750649-Hanusia_phi.AAC.3